MTILKAKYKTLITNRLNLVQSMLFVPFKNNKIIDEKYHFIRKIPKGLKMRVEKGGNVKGDSVLASGEVLEEKKKIDVARALGVKSSDAGRYLECLNGEMIVKGDLIARKRGKIMGKEKKVFATSSGVISLDEVDSGFVKVLGVAKEATIQAGIDGRVVSAIRNKHIDILTTVLRFKPFGIFGDTVQGEMYYIDQKEKIGPNLSKGIIICDFKVDAVYLRDLALSGVIGVVTGGIDFGLSHRIKSGDWWGLSIVVTEGFGNLRIGEDILSVLKINDGYLCLIDSAKEEIVLTNVQEDKDIKNQTLVKPLEIGSKVCIFDSTLWGVYGEVQEIGGEYIKVYTKQDDKEKSVDVHIDNLIAW
jgi:hypothetical protein